MTKSKILSRILLVISIIILILSFIGCSLDPKISPTCVYIVGIGKDRGRVLYDEDYSSRIIYMDANSTCNIKALTNRIDSDNEFVWSSNSDKVASIIDLKNSNATVNSHIYGVSMIEANYHGYTGHCFVIVDDGTKSKGITIKVSGVTGMIQSDTNEYIIEAKDTIELKDKKLNLSFKADDNSKISKTEWYLDSVLQSCNSTYDITFTSFGIYTVDCVVYGKNNYGVVEPIGSSTVTIECRF